jgi:hypothetical protein
MAYFAAYEEYKRRIAALLLAEKQRFAASA